MLKHFWCCPLSNGGYLMRLFHVPLLWQGKAEKEKADKAWTGARLDWLIFVHQETWAGVSTETFGERVTSQLLANSTRTSFAVAEYRVAYCSTRPGHFPNIAWPLSCAFVSQEVAGVAQNLFKCRYCLTKGRWFLDVLSYCKVIISFPDLLPSFDALYLRSTCAVTGGCFASSASKGCGRGCHASRRTTKTATAGGFTRWMHQKSQEISLDPLIHALHDVAWCENGLWWRHPRKWSQ